MRLEVLGSNPRLSNMIRTMLMLILVFADVRANWWSLGVNRFGLIDNHQMYILGVQPMSLACDKIPGLSDRQRRLCLRYSDHMPSVSEGAQMGIEECQYQFRNWQWNCSVIQGDSSVFGPIVSEIASKEAAFAYSVAAAGVVQSIARACREGKIKTCSCEINPQVKSERPSNLRKGWGWSGCGDAIEYGVLFARDFIDIKEKEQNYPRHSKSLARALMNLHNNEAGRRTVFKHAKLGCKCSGVSGSCTLRSCWQQLPSFRETGDRLRQRYTRALEVTFNKKGTKLKPPEPEDAERKVKKEELVYLEQSPNFCSLLNQQTGASSVRGRVCRLDMSATDSCDRLCCDQGYTTQLITVNRRCKCKFRWCCKVSCEICPQRMNVTTCN